MKTKFNELIASAKALLAEAETLINDGKFDEAKAKTDAAQAARQQAAVVKAQLSEADQTRIAELEAANAVLTAKAAEPVRPPFEPATGAADEPDATEGSTAKTDPVNFLRYGEPEAAVKAVIKDIYGAVDYNRQRDEQMAAFSKYVRFGETRLTAAELSRLAWSAKNLLVHPAVLKAEIEAGRSVAEIKATLEEGSNELGGYLVPEDFRMQVLSRLAGATVVRQRATVLTTARDAVEFPKLEGGDTRYTSAVRVTYVDETPVSATASETNPTWGTLRIPVNTVLARTNVSQNLLEDSGINLLQFLGEEFARAMAIDEDEQFLKGPGGNRPTGVLGAKATGADVSPVTGVSVANSGAAAALTPDGMIDLVYTLDSQYRGSAVLVMAKNTQRDVRKFKDGESRYMWQPALVAGQPATLLGYPVAESQAMPAVAANAHPIIFGDWKGYFVVDRVGMSVKRVEDTTTAGTNTIALFARRRFGGGVARPWYFAAAKVSA